MSSTTHWEAVFRGRPSEELGWYEQRPSTLDLVLEYSRPEDAVIDVGSGDSRLADELVVAGYRDVTLLDLSEAALARVRSRLGSGAEHVHPIRADVTDWTPSRRWELWHDRAVFHFLVADDDRAAYKAVAVRAVPAGGRMIIATFALDGPEQCAGLPVRRYAADELASFFAPEFVPLEHRRQHPDPSGVGDSRPYVVVVLERT